MEKIWIKADSLLVVDLLKNNSVPIPWRLHCGWSIFLNCLSQMEFVISHFYREGNQVANKLASFVVRCFHDHW